MKTFVFSYIATNGVVVLNSVINADSRAEAIIELNKESKLYMVLSSVEIKSQY